MQRVNLLKQLKGGVTHFINRKVHDIPNSECALNYANVQDIASSHLNILDLELHILL